MAAGLNVCRASQWTGFPSTGFRNNESLFGAITGFLPDGRVNRSICHPSARSAETAAGQSAAMRTNIDERFMSELYQSADTGGLRETWGGQSCLQPPFQAAFWSCASQRSQEGRLKAAQRAPRSHDWLPHASAHHFADLRRQFGGGERLLQVVDFTVHQSVPQNHLVGIAGNEKKREQI